MLPAILAAAAAAAPQIFTVDLTGPTRPFHKPFLECVGSSHMAMGLLVNDSSSAPGTAAGLGEQGLVQHGAGWKGAHDQSARGCSAAGEQRAHA